MIYRCLCKQLINAGQRGSHDGSSACQEGNKQGRSIHTAPMADEKTKVSVHKRHVPPRGYRKIKRLGQGAFGDVYLVKRERDDKRLVCKVERHPSARGHSNEVEILRDLEDHDRIVRLYAFVDQPYNCQIILEHCAGGDLHTLESRHGNRFSEAFVRHVFLQLAEALAFIHAGLIRRPGRYRSIPSHHTPVIHRDIKPENIFLRTKCEDSDSFPDIVLGDFGCATTELCSYFYSTTSFQGPEIPTCTRRGDVWMVGAVIHDLLLGFEPIAVRPAGYEGDWNSAPHARKVFTLPSTYSSSLNRLMNKALTMCSADRPSSIELLDAVLDSNYHYRG